jgi:glycosyltransferase involved in cell wall biosynthesis
MSQRLTIAWLCPPPAPGQGGIRNIVRMCRHLAAFGHDVRVHVEPCSFRDQAELTAWMARHYGPSGATYRCGFRDIGPVDAVVATLWTTAAVARSHPSARARFYFVQDYEPEFYPPGSRERAQAEETYRLGLHPICSGPWCAQVLRERFGVTADHFRFPVDRSVYRPLPRRGRGPHVVFFARPGVPRRCFPLGVAALAIVHRHMPQVAISLFGSPRTHTPPPPFPHRHLGLVPDLQGLAELYAEADVGVAFSTTNPSLVPLEMMACGCPVVDLDNEVNRMSYPPDAIRLAPPTPEGVAAAVLALLRDPDLRQRQRRAALDFVATFPGEEEAARAVEASLLRGLGMA